ncbi:TPR-like protein [Neolentinus lepideus HHB14362 ss-1]|uniref:TPR-like protein n=1 Tax=Neolentinus lepideus HHB14362 ss-1 TaxID=1314782 RepID=A0A165NUV1_9AGAM|nr:TPR-like protein [Neolentinus lepideus HHB14362 ss-1]
MGRSRTKSKKTHPPPTKPAPSEQPKPAPSISALLGKARELLVQCDYDLARRFIERLLESQPEHAEAKEMLGVVQLETGNLDAAKQTFLSLLTSPSAPPSAHLYLAQLSDVDPHLALRHYQSAVDMIMAQLKGKERAVDANVDKDEAILKNTAVQALISMVELWMDPSYDLCDAPEAEQTCENLLNLARQIDPDNTEVLQTLASVRLSQSRPDDAKEILERAWAKWKNLELDDETMPSIETRLSLVKLLLELSLFKSALEVLQGVIATNDQSVEAWYLEGWCFFLMAEQARENGFDVEDLSWMDLARDARDCMEMCQNLSANEESPDMSISEYVKELIEKLQVLGVEPSPAGEDEEDGWEDVEGSDEDDNDVDMS